METSRLATSALDAVSELTFDQKLDLVNFTFTSPTVLSILASQDTTFRVRIARNQFAPPDLLTQLASTGHYSVKEAVALNLSTPPVTLIQLAREPSWTVRSNVAHNPATPAAAWDR